jgi:mono/diheme cytochrome c family protein
MKHSCYFVIVAFISLMMTQCGSNTQSPNGQSAMDSSVKKGKTDTVVILLGINSKGIGRFKDVQLSHPPDESMAAKGKAIFQSKCFACHKLTSETLVGPGWAGVTSRRMPEWIMNWITNTKVMVDQDLIARTERVVCLIRMPNQDLTDEQARNVLEFMRKNDGDK